MGVNKLTGKAFKNQLIQNYGANEFKFPEYDDDAIIDTKTCIEVIRIKDNKTRKLNIKTVLNGNCMHFTNNDAEKRSYFIEKWAGCYKYKRVCFLNFVYYGINKSSQFFCHEHQKIYFQTPEKFEKDPFCPECSDFIMNPSKYWLKLLPGVIQSLHSEEKTEYTIPGTNYVVDGFDHVTKTVMEYNGCRTSHMCPICLTDEVIEEKKQRMSTVKFERWKNSDKYNKTIEKKKKCIELGYHYIDMWHCIWVKMRNSREKITEYVEMQNKLYETKIKNMIRDKEESKDSWF